MSKLFEMANDTERGKLVYIPTDCIEPHPDNPRKNLGDLTELAVQEKEPPAGKPCRGRGLRLFAFLTDGGGKGVLYRPATCKARLEGLPRDFKKFGPFDKTFGLTIEREHTIA